MNTEYIKLTDLWNDGQYLEVGRIINNEQWNPTEVAKFCAYFTKYLGTHQLDILHKFL
jgi:hypothetical protein|tara:strand:- start:16281 stop:16454 length:174 start_codon:yes stop_codon:yes gene_type:complete